MPKSDALRAFAKSYAAEVIGGQTARQAKLSEAPKPAVTPLWTLGPSDSLALTLEGPPRTKKTHGRIIQLQGRGQPKGVKRPIMLPSKAWADWLKGLQSAPVRYRLLAPEPPSSSTGDRYWTEAEPALAQPVNCRATIYRDRRGGDAVGYYQGIADVLEKLHILDNDRRIVSWDGSALKLAGKAVRPCVVVHLTPATDPDAS